MAVYAYSRCSHRDSTESGAGLAAQDSENDRVYHDVLENSPENSWGAAKYDHDRPGHFCDKTVSAFRIPLFQRKAGKVLQSILKPGDYVVCAKVDRMFRTVYDMVTTVKWMSEKGVNVRFGNIEMDTGTPSGKIMLSLLSMMAEWESHMKSMRQKEASEIRRMRKANVVPVELVHRLGDGDKPSATIGYVKPTKMAKSAVFDTDILQFAGKERFGGEKSSKENKPGKVWVYLRCSHIDSSVSGLGVDWQKKTCMRRAERLLKENPLLTMGDVVYDDAVSAYRFMFRNRPGGGRIFKEAKAGDHILIARIDRGFRNTRDIAETIPTLMDRGVTVQFVSDNLDFSTVWGRACLMVMASFAEMEPALTSARTRDALRELRAQGRGIGKAFAGFKMIEENGEKRMVLNRRDVALRRLAYYLHKVCGLSQEKTSNRIEALLAKREGRKEIPLSGAELECAMHCFKLPWDVIMTISQGKMLKNHGKKRGNFIRRIVTKRVVERSVEQWPALRGYLEKKRRDARLPKESRRDNAEMLDEMLHDRG